MSRVGAAFAKPNKGRNQSHDGEQPKGNPEYRQPKAQVEEGSEKPEVIWQAIDRHRNCHRGRKVGMGEIANLLSDFRYRQGTDRDIEPSLGKPIEIPAQIG